MRAWMTALAMAIAAPAGAHAAPASPAPAVSMPPPADVASPEAIIAALYAVISGPADKPRDWPRMHGLFVPGGMLEAAGKAKDTGEIHARMLTVDEYAANAARIMATMGFYEHGAIGHVWRYANIASVTSPYESRHAPGEAPFARGINVFQLMYDGTRWWVVSIYWEGETPAFPLPHEAEALLKAN